MGLWTVLPNIVVSATGAGLALFAKYLLDKSLQGVTQRHSKEAAEIQNAFSMGATSHMATVAFDKHICFCEKYVKAASNALENPLDAREFFRIRQESALWLTREIETKLDEFEQKIAKIGSEAQSYGPGGVPSESNESTIKDMIMNLREVLGTEKLTALRNKFLVGSLKKPPQGG